MPPPPNHKVHDPYPPPGSDNEVLIHVWNTAKGRFGRIRRGGHISITLRRKGREPVYISWWPRNAAKYISWSPDPLASLQHDIARQLLDRTKAGLQAGRMAPRPDQVQVLVDGKWEWGRLPDRTITIPSRNDGTGLPGLDDEAIERWWQRWLSLRPSYVWYSTSRNCAGVAGQALLAGGAEDFAGPLAADYPGALTPNAVDKWAQKVAAEVAQRRK